MNTADVGTALCVFVIGWILFGWPIGLAGAVAALIAAYCANDSPP